MLVPVPCGQPVVVFEQSWNCTVPVTVPAEPVSVAVSVSEPPTLIEVLLTWVATAGGAATAFAISARSWLPSPVVSMESWAMWYGEPLMALAELPTPQSSADAMCPPQARTTSQPPDGGVPDRLKVMEIVVAHTPVPCTTFWLT